jgi:translation initiation factor IF-3
MSPHKIKSLQNKSNLNSLAFGFKPLDTNTCGTALTSRPFLPIYGYSEGIADADGQLKQDKEKVAIRRPMKSALPVQKDGPRINEEIRVREVQLIDASGHNHGPTPIQAALDMAQAAGLDLVEIAPNSAPPVCKILDYGKYKFQAQKKAAEARKKQKVVEVKEIKLRPMIDDHDYDVKMRSMKRFFEEGDKVKITLRFRGREMAHQELGYKLLERVKADTGPFAKIESEPRFEGRQMVMMLAPR